MVLDRVTRSLLIGGDWRRQGCVLGGVLNRVYRCPRLGYRQGAGHMEQLDWPTHTDNQRHLYTHTHAAKKSTCYCSRYCTSVINSMCLWFHPDITGVFSINIQYGTLCGGHRTRDHVLIHHTNTSEGKDSGLANVPILHRSNKTFPKPHIYPQIIIKQKIWIIFFFRKP